MFPYVYVGAGDDGLYHDGEKWTWNVDVCAEHGDGGDVCFWEMLHL